MFGIFLQRGQNMKVTVISFSGRENGNCQSIAKAVLAFYRKEDTVLYDFAGFDLSPCGKCALECFYGESPCPFGGDRAIPIFDSVTNSDLTYFIIPNYCDYPCANYFILNERSQCYFQGRPDLLRRYLAAPKRFIVVSNTEQENFRTVLSQQTDAEPEILFLSAKAYGKVSIRGDLLSSPAVAETLLRFLKQ